MILKQTALSQRSYDNSWAVNGDIGELPPGVIIDMSINIFEDFKVGIASMTTADDTISITLVKQYKDLNIDILATLTTDVCGTPVSLIGSGGECISAVIGYIPKDLHVVLADPVILSPICVKYLRDNIIGSLNIDSAAGTYVADKRHVLVTDGNLSIVTDNKTGSASLFLTPAGVAELSSSKYVDSSSTRYVLKSINGVRPTNSDGLLSISISGLNIIKHEIIPGTICIDARQGFDRDDIVLDTIKSSRNMLDGPRATDVMFNSEGVCDTDQLPGMLSDPPEISQAYDEI